VLVPTATDAAELREAKTDEAWRIVPDETGAGEEVTANEATNVAL